MAFVKDFWPFWYGTLVVRSYNLRSYIYMLNNVRSKLCEIKCSILQKAPDHLHDDWIPFNGLVNIFFYLTSFFLSLAKIVHTVVNQINMTPLFKNSQYWNFRIVDYLKIIYYSIISWFENSQFLMTAILSQYSLKMVNFVIWHHYLKMLICSILFYKLYYKV